MTVHAATYSGTATFLEVSAEVAGKSGGDDGIIVRVPPAALGNRSLAPISMSGALEVPVDGSRHIVRLAPVSPPGPYELSFDTVEVRIGSGVPASLAGDWRLTLRGPRDPDEALRTEQLASGSSADTEGIRVTSAGALRSTSETLVRVRVESEKPLGALAVPRLLGAAPDAFGVALGPPADDGMVTFTFPPTPFGSAIDVTFDSFFEPGGPAQSIFEDIAIGTLLARQGVTARFHEWAIIERGDVLAKQGTKFESVATWFAKTSAEIGDHANLVAFGVKGPIETGLGFWLELPDGTALMPRGTGSSYGVDVGGLDDAGAERSYVQFLVLGLDNLPPVVRLVYGKRSEPIAGPWRLTFAPQP